MCWKEKAPRSRPFSLQLLDSIANTGGRELVPAQAHGTDSRPVAQDSFGYVCYPADGATLSADNALCPSVSTETQQGSYPKEYVMRNSFTRKQIAVAVACALALGVFSATATPRSGTQWNIDRNALVVDERGRVGRIASANAGTPASPAPCGLPDAMPPFRRPLRSMSPPRLW
jgi:hypothetical protein